ncbi:ankyrin repeat domain-containing protein [Marimonas lutisalis]|uniref:ankyrin repeat domain-containing protein n=1 Tax=Marimonas lutisalis TaxID=2545756 RepID=UPI0010F77928|nr:ankyrin repeat domain-containing protein [Marimonas lutisalis]
MARASDAEDRQKAVLITGATSGIGLRMAEILSQNGFFIYAGARKPEDIERLNRMDNVRAVLDEVLEAERAARAAPPARGMSLHEAAFSGDLEALRAALAQGADPDAPDATGATPLIVATTFDHPAAVEVLLSAGAAIDKPNGDGSTPLHMAALLCREEILRTLLANGADKTLRTKSGSTAHDIVTVPFDQIKPLYDYLGAALEPYGLTLDQERIRTERPVIAGILSAP